MYKSRLRLVEDHINLLLHPEGYHLRLWRHPSEDKVTISLTKLTLDASYLGDQVPKVKTSQVDELTCTEEDLCGD